MNRNRVLGDRFTGEKPLARPGIEFTFNPGFLLAEEFAKEMMASCGNTHGCDIALKDYKPGKCPKADKCPRMKVPR